ncbi:hypothetical protein TRSC58_02285 [Trypanosoma rangeli SC58]|uniref:GRAM domain-containing protein n=1 Tax=Trypanosoma rangeli SC58 TaxID=429131 RepID=A0A061J9M1_TRYRA|nr:hypothetical protein TRSC58_02285 [Trypanosoma rangeli SC58]
MYMYVYILAPLKPKLFFFIIIIIFYLVRTQNMSSDPLSDNSKAPAQPGGDVAASYTSEEQSFHRLFPQIPLSEKLVESRQCGLLTRKKKIVRMGTLYTSSLRLCFSSFFLKEPVMMRWEDVISLEKRTNFLFECIVVKTNQEEEYLFSGFLFAGASQIFKLLKTLWTVRARYAFAQTSAPQIQSPSTVLADPASPKPSFESFYSRQRSSYANDKNEWKNEDVNPLSPLASSPKATHSEMKLSNPLNDSPANDFEANELPLQNHDTEEEAHSLSTSNESLPIQASFLENAEDVQYSPNIPRSELLVDSFHCSYVSGMHRLGRLYITTKYIVFSSLMMAESLQISFTNVSSIEREQTMMILDGIVIKLSDGERYSFTSFVSRDAAFNILTHFFNVTKALKLPAQILSRTFAESNTITEFTTQTSEPDVSKFPTVDTLDEFSKVLTDYGTAFSDVSCFTKELVGPIVLPEGKTVLDVFRICFDDNASLLEEYHTARKDTNQKWEPWRPAKTGSPQFSGQRLFTCTTIIRALISKTCPFTEYQRYAFMNIGGKEPTLVVQLSGQAEGVMFADAFRAETLLIFTQLGASVTMRALGHIQFLRDVWVKGKILRTSISTEMPECYRKLGSMLIGRLQGNTLDSSGVRERFEASPPLHVCTVESRKDFSHASVVAWKPAVYVEFVLEVLGVLLCVNSLLQTYSF